MIIECAHCHAKYQYDEARFDGKPAKKIRCAKCQQVFEIHNPSAGGTAASPKSTAPRPPPPTPSPKPGGKAPREDTMDSTMARKLRTVEEPLPSEFRQEAPAPPVKSTTPKMPEGRRLSLAIIEGPDAGKVYRIEKPRVVIGRTGADLVLNDTESSRHHAAIEIRETEILLQDLGSTNGTLVDGSKIQGQIELYNQGEFQIGATTLMLIVTDDG